MDAKLILYIASSLNGKIARSDGSIDWLEKIANPNQSDYGFKEFYESMSYTIQGRSTYDQLLNWDIPFPYPSTENYVISSQTGKPTQDVQYWKDSPESLIKEIKSKGGGRVWLIGGGVTNTNFLNAGLIDEFRIFIMPVILSDGIQLFEGKPREQYLSLMDHKIYASGSVELKYKLLE